MWPYHLQSLNIDPNWGNEKSNMDQTTLQGTQFCQTKTYGYLLQQSKYDKDIT
jgi:hypothetical protein